jgi:predicted amidohydrolase YtcJ
LLNLCSAASNAETVFHNFTGHTSTEAGIHDFSVLVVSDDGKVVATGDSTLLGKYPGAARTDGNGQYLLPGLIDAHAHVHSLGRLAITLDLNGTPSILDAVQQIEKFAAQNRYAEWILGRGWNQVLWAIKEFPKSSDIDAVVSTRPVWLRRIDGHAGWANSKAMKIAGIDDDTPDPVGGKIVRDANGKATGILIDKAMNLLEAHIPKPDKDEIRRAYRTAIRKLVSLGMTGVHDTGINTQEAEVYMSMADDGELDMRIYAMVSDAGENLDAIGSPLTAYGGDKLDIAAVKLYADGALGSRGAALLEPYSDDSENRGLPFWTAEELFTFTKKANDMGFQVGIHAIGDSGNRMVLDAFEKAQGGRHSELRNRVEHAQIISLDDIPRFAELGVIASMQATHATSDMNMAEDRLGPDRIKGGYAWRRLLDSGAVIANGSDFPVELPNPFYGLYASVTRQDRSGMPEGGWYIDQGMTRAEALHSFTLAAAYAAHQEDRMGSLEAGKWADFIIVDRDYFKIPSSEIDDIQVIETWVGGKRVFNAKDREQR